MTFLNPGILGALLAVAVPVLIHLLHRRRARTFDWGAMRFLVDSVAARRRKRGEEMTIAAQDSAARLTSLPPAAVLVIAALAAAGWWAVHRRDTAPGGRGRAALQFLLRTAVAFIALLAGLEAAGHLLILGTAWPTWSIALIGAVLVEGVLSLYSLERERVSTVRGRLLVGLRVALALLVIAMLAQPVFVWESNRRLQRTVAVMLDRSLSMGVRDTGLTPSVRVRTAAALLGLEVERPVELERSAATIEREAAQRLHARAEWLRMLRKKSREEMERRLEAEAEALLGELESVKAELQKQARVLRNASGAESLPGPAPAEPLKAVTSRLTEQVLPSVEEALRAARSAPDRPAERYAALVETLQDAEKSTVSLVEELRRRAGEVDAALYQTLAPSVRRKVDRLADSSRLELARMVLTGGDEARRGLLRTLAEQYQVRLYGFGGRAEELDASPWLGDARAGRFSVPTGTESEGDETPDIQPEETDLAGAVERAMRDVPEDRLAGTVLLTDGRKTAGGFLAPVARRSGLGRVPVCSVVFGAEEPPRDAAIASLRAPPVVHEENRVLVSTEVKMDGLAGEKVQVSLYRTGESGEDTVVDSEVVKVEAPRRRLRLQLADKPPSAGLQRYRVVVSQHEGEVFTDNNAYPVTVKVTDEKTNVLLIAGRPNWEFRYLKNLFAHRESSLDLQYVVTRPDRIEGLPRPPTVHASATREEDPQATALPKNAMEWMKFDVVILGDVSPEVLTDAHLETLRRFVADRGGVAVVVAGPRYMPNAFDRTPLEELLPILFTPRRARELEPPEPCFRLELSDEGRTHPVMQQSVDPEENEEVWTSLPDLYWRRPIAAAKPGATILARAQPCSEEEPAGATADARAEEGRRALVAFHRVGLGRVMLVNFRTWRMRYRAGDEYHHKFWGGVIRWGSAQKLPSGTTLVKLGTDGVRYAPGQGVHVRARILRSDLSPMANAEAAVNVRSRGRPVLRRRLDYVPDSPGIYACDLGGFPPGEYDVALECPRAEPLLEGEGTEEVSTSFSVVASTSPEKLELAPDRELLRRAADLSEGVAAEVWEAERVLEALAPPDYVRSERFDFTVWNSWPLLILMIGVAGAEWLLRKTGGLP